MSRIAVLLYGCEHQGIVAFAQDGTEAWMCEKASLDTIAKLDDMVL